MPDEIVPYRANTSTLMHTSYRGTTVRDAVFQMLREFGINKIFGNPGSTELPMFRDFPSDWQYILGLQESSVVAMADGYALATNNASVVNLHSAAGVGHAMGSIFTAYKNCAPIIITAGQQARSILPYEPFLYSERATELPLPYVKWSCEPARAEDVPAAIARAYYMAMQPPRGPVLVSVPVDDWDVPCSIVRARQISQRSQADEVVLRVVADALNTSTRPVFVVGAGVDRDGAWETVVKLAERHQAPVWVAPLSARCSFPENHPLFAGFLTASREHIVDNLLGHDVAVVLGAPVFTYHVEGNGPHVPDGTALFQLVDDAAQATWAPMGTTAIGDVDLSARWLLERSDPPNRTQPQVRRLAPDVTVGQTITPALVMQTLNRLKPANSIVVEESPSSRGIMQRYLVISQPASFYACASGGLGYAMPASVGIALAQTKLENARKVIVLIGDGSCMYSPQALWSAANLKLPVTFIVLNNKRYQSLHGFAPVFGLEAAIGSELPGLNFVELAKSQGCHALKVETPEQLDDIMASALNASQPTLLEIVVG